MTDKEEKIVIKKSPHHGLGVFARRRLLRGDLISEERPLVSLDSRTALNSSIQPELLSKLAKLNDCDQQIFYSFSDCYSQTPSPIGIFRTNALPLGDRSTAGAIFPIASRLNHSCVPNVNHNWNENKGVETVYVLKDLEAGEELLTCYKDVCETRANRQQLLRQLFNFDCKCQACSITDAKELEMSDKRRTMIKSLDEEIPLLTSINPDLAIRKAELLLEFLEQEGLGHEASLVGRASYDAFSISFQTTRNKKNLTKWAKLTVDNFMVAKGYFDGRFKDQVNRYYNK